MPNSKCPNRYVQCWSQFRCGTIEAKAKVKAKAKPQSPKDLKKEKALKAEQKKKDKIAKALKAKQVLKAKKEAAIALGSCKQLAAKVRWCKPYKCQQPHPRVAGFMSIHRIIAKESDHCHYSQKLPNGKILDCRLSDEDSELYAVTLGYSDTTVTKIILEKAQAFHLEKSKGCKATKPLLDQK